MLQTFHLRTPFFYVPKWQCGGQNCMADIPIVNKGLWNMIKPFFGAVNATFKLSHKPVVFAKPLVESRLVFRSN
jgi:hypothetical protein